MTEMPLRGGESPRKAAKGSSLCPGLTPRRGRGRLGAVTLPGQGRSSSAAGAAAPLVKIFEVKTFGWSCTFQQIDRSGLDTVWFCQIIWKEQEVPWQRPELLCWGWETSCAPDASRHRAGGGAGNGAPASLLPVPGNGM